ncbi:MAG TPA: hypothetical protein VGK41_05480 [Solirubrobacterales bacterium]
MKSLVPFRQRAYLASHPLALLLSIGIAFNGYVNLIFPGLSESSAAVVLPPLMLALFNLTWAVGGTLSTFGLVRGKAKVESAGMSLLASGLVTLFASILYLKPAAVLGSAAFLVTLAVGCFLRARHLSDHTYVSLDIPLDQPGLREPQ